jgi:DNA processing protein
MSDLFSPTKRPLQSPSGVKLSDAQRLDWLRLYRSENIGPRTFQHLINKFGGASAALEALPTLAKQRGKQIVICSLADAERELETARRHNAVFIARGEPDYPAALANIEGGPPIIAVKGRVEIFQSPFVAIVGSRNASAVGMKMAEVLSHGLNDAGFAIASGLARGIDTRAHFASLSFGTVAVLAGGLDKPYPPENLKLLDELMERGAVIAEMPFGWEPRGRDFPRRNRIISGLAYGTVIVEAARKSGSLITAKFALEQGREVFAVPGSPLDPRADGTNDLIRNGATLVTKTDDIIAVLAPMVRDGMPFEQSFMQDDGSYAAQNEELWDELDLEGIASAPQVSFPLADAFEETAQIIPTPQNTNTPVQTFAQIKQNVLNLLSVTPVDTDELIRSAKATPRDIQTILLDLELEGILERHSGNRVSLI